MMNLAAVLLRLWSELHGSPAHKCRLMDLPRNFRARVSTPPRDRSLNIRKVAGALKRAAA
jgi:hypothetical protein